MFKEPFESVHGVCQLVLFVWMIPVFQRSLGWKLNLTKGCLRSVQAQILDVFYGTGSLIMILNVDGFCQSREQQGHPLTVLGATNSHLLPSAPGSLCNSPCILERNRRRIRISLKWVPNLQPFHASPPDMYYRLRLMATVKNKASVWILYVTETLAFLSTATQVYLIYSGPPDPGGVRQQREQSPYSPVLYGIVLGHSVDCRTHVQNCSRDRAIMGRNHLE